MRRVLGPALVVVLLGFLAAGYLLLRDPRPSGEHPTITTRPTASSTPREPSSSPPPTPSGYAARVVQDDPLAFWPLSETGRTARDVMGRFPATYVDARPGRAFSSALGRGTGFNGTDTRVTANSVTTVSSWPGYTMEAWVRLTQEATEEHIVAFNTPEGGNGPGLLHDQPTRKFKFRDCEGETCAEVFSVEVPRLGVPYLIDVSVDQNNNGTLYVNGRSQATFVSAHRPPLDGFFTIGAEFDAGPTPESFFNGEIADVAIYTHALSPVAVMAHYHDGL